MSRLILSAALILGHVVLVAWWPDRFRGGAEVSFLAVLAGIAASAAAERWRFGRGGGWRARLDPVVVLAFLAAFDVVHLGLPMLRDG